MTKLRTGWAAIALLAGTTLATTAFAGAAHAQAGKQLAQLAPTAVRPSPIHALPQDAADESDGLERQEAMGGTLNAQLASLKQPVHAKPATLVESSEADGEGDAAPAAPAAPAGPSVAMARRFVDAAGAFEHYMRVASAIHADFRGGEAVIKALESGGAYEQTQLEQGAIAYGAMAALQDPNFVETLSELTSDPRARDAVARQLEADPEAVMQTPGARGAAARAASAIGRMGGSLYASGAAVKQSAYDIQHQPWSKAAVLAPEAELAHLKQVSGMRVALKIEDTNALMTSLVAMRNAPQTPMMQGPVSPVVARALALAALAVLGEADEGHAEQVAPILEDAKSSECVKMARLNLYQCLSVAGPQYENVFCLGQHAMMDTAQCVVSASGWAPATAAGSVSVPVAIPSAPVAPPPVMVPVALAATPGMR